ncbi:MAG: uridine kinase family protein [Candidatus Nanopelagicales bacterium]
MRLTTHPGEPEAAPWKPLPFPDFVCELQRFLPAEGRSVIAVDGRSAGGKTTLTARLVAALPAAKLVHTDDVAWWHDFFAWDDLLISGILAPYLAGEAVSCRPPAWDERGRPGAIEVSAKCRTLVVEGVGASRASLRPYLSAAIWVQSDWKVAEQRGIARDMLTERPDPVAAKRFWDEWEGHERPFLAADRPWDRADFVLCGTPPEDLDLRTDVLVGAPKR